MVTQRGLMALAAVDRGRLHVIPLAAALFLAFYGKLVCPFIDGLTGSQLASTLSAVVVFQILFREFLFHRFPAPPGDVRSIVRQGYRLSVISWMASGVVAMGLHIIVFPTFPLASHLKLLSGYWALGAGILAQLEYAVLERLWRKRMAGPTPDDGQHSGHDPLAKRVLEGYGVFSAVPVILLVLVIARYFLEGALPAKDALEATFLGVVLMAIALGVGWNFSRTLRQDTQQIVDGLRDVGAGNFKGLLDTTRPDELGRIAGALNDMAGELEQRERLRQIFGRYVPESVAQSLIAGDSDGALRPQSREATIMFADLAGFTGLSETMEPEQVVDMLNAYFSMLGAIVERHDGVITQFQGDAVLVTFNVPLEDADHARQALLSALEIQRAVATQTFAGRRLSCRIGINTGSVTAGSVGAEGRLSYTVHGDAVNVAARLEQLNKTHGTQVLVSETTRHLAGPGFSFQPLGEIDVRGRSQQVAIHVLLGDEAG
jgi:adenylate cyclase